MPIEAKTLAAIARDYVRTMTSIRGRRIHRLLMREFAQFDYVVPAMAEDGNPALLALAGDGSSLAVCQSDGRGKAAKVVRWARLEGAGVTTSYDLAKDSLPILSWTIWHPGFAGSHGALSITAAAFSQKDQSKIADILARLGGESA